MKRLGPNLFPKLCLVHPPHHTQTFRPVPLHLGSNFSVCHLVLIQIFICTHTHKHISKSQSNPYVRLRQLQHSFHEVLVLKTIVANKMQLFATKSCYRKCIFGKSVELFSSIEMFLFLTFTPVNIFSCLSKFSWLVKE